MGLFGNKKNEQQPAGNQDKSVHRTFQIGAILLMGFIVYSLYFEDNKTQNDTQALSSLTQEQLNERIKEAFQRMADSPKYKEIKDFVQYMETNTDGKTAKILEGNDGIIIYLPNSVLSQSKNSVDLEDEKQKISIKSEKKPQLLPNPAESLDNTAIDEAKKTDSRSK